MSTGQVAGVCKSAPTIENLNRIDYHLQEVLEEGNFTEFFNETEATYVCRDPHKIVNPLKKPTCINGEWTQPLPICNCKFFRMA